MVLSKSTLKRGSAQCKVELNSTFISDSLFDTEELFISGSCSINFIQWICLTALMEEDNVM